jgi:hypothetical protein
MTPEQIEFWKFILSVIGTGMVVIGAFAGALRYFQERQEDRKTAQAELAWRKTQFLFELANDFKQDPHHQTVWKLLAYGTSLPKDSSLSKILGEELNGLNTAELGLRYAIDNYLDFFDRLSYFVYGSKALEISDLEFFGWYIAQIGESQEIGRYASSAGFDSVLQLYVDLHQQFGEKHWYKTVRLQNATSRKHET